MLLVVPLTIVASPEEVTFFSTLFSLSPSLEEPAVVEQRSRVQFHSLFRQTKNIVQYIVFYRVHKSRRLETVLERKQ